MGEFTAGDVIVPVVPSARGFISELKKQVLGDAYKAGRDIGREMSRGIRDVLTGIYAPVKEQTQKQKQQAPKDGEQIGGAFAQGFKKRVEAAFKTLPKANLDADATPAQVKIQEIRARLAELGGKTVGVDVDVAAAEAELTALAEHLRRLDGEEISVDVRADVAAALAALGAVEERADHVDGRTANVRVDVDTGAALVALGVLQAGLVAVTAVPVAATVGAGLLALSGPLAVAGVGFAGLAAVAVPSVTRISEALKEQEQATKAAAGAATGGAAAAAQAASRAASLAAAEQAVTDAKRTARQAEQDLTQARKDAKQAMDDLARSVKDAALSEEDAALSVEEARKRLDKVRADPTADDLTRKRAELSYKQAVQHLDDQRARTKQLKDDQKAADKAGIEGSPQVVAAKEKIRAASQRVADTQRALKVAQLQAAASAKQAASSSGGLLDKYAKLSPAAKTAAAAIKGFKDSYLAWQQKLEPAVLPVVTGALKLATQLFKPLTPIIKGTAGALVTLEKKASKALGGKFWKDFFKQISAVAPTAVTGLGKAFGSLITGGAGIVKAFLPFVPTVVGGIQKAAGAFARFGTGLGKSDAFKTFIEYVKQNAPKIFSVVKDVVSAIGTIVKDLAPLGPVVLSVIGGIASLISKMPPGTFQALAIAIGAVALAVKVWGISQKVLNVALSSNPIGLIITAVGLLVAALIYAWNNSETFRNVVTTVWEAISTAVQWAWVNVIQPAVQAIVDFWNNTLAPAITWLWQNVFKPAWDGIAAAVEWAWKNVIQPNLILLEYLFKNVIGPVATWLWKNVIKPAFEGIAGAVKTAWERVIQPALKMLHDFVVNTLAPKVKWLWEAVIKPAWDGIGSAIGTAWTKVIKPVFDFLVGFITKDIPDGFKKGVSLIGQFWDGVKEVAKKPVQFIVDVVYNNGIVKIWNAVADILGMKDKRLSPLKFARGGIMPGYTPGRDVALAAVSGGEAIMRPEWTRAVGEDYVHGANAAARKGGVGGVARFLGVAGDPGFAGAFAGGGIVGSLRDLLAGGLKAGAEKFLNPLLDQASKAMGDSPWAKMLTGVPKTMVANVIKWIGDHDSGGGDGGKALAFAKAQIGKPYKWGGTGPDAFDCSGLVMRAWQSAGVTDIPRVSQAQMAWVHPVAKPQPGDLGFPHPGHVWMYSSPASKIVEAPYTGAKIREVAARSAQLIGRPPSLFDSGGLLEPGTSLVHNGTGRPEPVLTDRQWKAIAQVPVKGGDGGKALVNIEGDYIAENGMSPYEAAREFRYQLGSQIGPF